MSTATTTTTPPRVRRPWRAALVILVLLLGLPTAAWWYLDWSAERDFQAALAETDALDPGWRLEDMLAARAPIPDERNAYKQLESVHGLVRGVSLGATFDGPLNVRIHAVDAAVLKKRLEPLAAARRAAHMLKDLPDGRRPNDYDATSVFTSFQWLQEVREVAAFLQHDAQLRNYDGDSAEIGGACRAQINAARAMGEELSLIAVLVRVVCMEIAAGNLERAIAQHELPADELLAIEKLLQREIDSPKLLTAMRGERTVGLNAWQAVREGRVKPPDLGRGKGGFRGWLDNLLPASRSFDRAGYLRAMNEIVEAGKLPVDQQLNEMERIRDQWIAHDAATSSIVAVSNKSTQANARSQAKLRCAMVAVAAERYRQREGFWPGSLEALVQAKFIGSVPLDPYDGKILRSRKLADGFLVYSVGVDRTDNGGVLDRSNVTAAGADIGFQLWDMPFRGLPAPPQEP